VSGPGPLARQTLCPGCSLSSKEVIIGVSHSLNSTDRCDVSLKTRRLPTTAGQALSAQIQSAGLTSVTPPSFRLQAGHMPSWQGFRLCLVFLPRTAAVVTKQILASSNFPVNGV